MKKTNHIFYISGGMGKNIMATAVVANLKRQFPEDDVIIASPYPDIWKYNPDIIAVMNPEHGGEIYKKYVLGSVARVYRLEPYVNADYIYRQKHLVEVWCELYGIPCTDMTPMQPLDPEEMAAAKKKIEGKLGAPLAGQKIFLIQTSGGAPQQVYPISWSRDLPLPIAELVCKEMKEKGYRPIHLRRGNQLALEHAEYLDLTLRESLCLISFSEKRLFIDSFAQHAAAAFEKPSVVAWISNSPTVFGYEMHDNITPVLEPEFRHHINSFLEAYNITGSIDECPYSSNMIFSVDDIVKKLS